MLNLLFNKNILKYSYSCYTITITTIIGGGTLLLEIKFDSEIAIYEQLRRQIIIGIAKGDIKKGERLPSVRQLGEDIGINLHTVRKTYNQLKDEGYLVIDRRVGAMVSEEFRVDSLEFNENILSELEFLTADASNRNISKEDFLKLCEDLYDQYEGRA